MSPSDNYIAHMRERDSVRVTSVECTAAIGDTPIALGLHAYAAAASHTWHEHSEAIVAFVIGGDLREQVRAGDHVASAFDVGIKPSGQRHTDHFGSNGAIVLRLALDPCGAPLTQNQVPMLSDWRWMPSDAVNIHAWMRLARVLRRTPRADDLDDYASDALSTLHPVNDCSRHEAPHWLRRARERIVDEASQGTRLAAIARDVGVHPVYFARQFRRYYGCSVGELIRSCRVRAAASLLAAGGNRIASAAYIAGFADQAHLSRVFRSATGITPSHFRALTEVRRSEAHARAAPLAKRMSPGSTSSQVRPSPPLET